MPKIKKVSVALDRCYKLGKEPKCILVSYDFFDELVRESVKNLGEDKALPFRNPDKTYSLFGIRLVRTPDLDKDVKLFEIIV